MPATFAVPMALAPPVSESAGQLAVARQSPFDARLVAAYLFYSNFFTAGLPRSKKPFKLELVLILCNRRIG